MSSMPTLPDAANFSPPTPARLQYPRGTQPVIDGAEDNVTEPREVLAVVPVLFDRVAVDESAAMDPEQYGSFLAVIDARREDVDAETILAYVVIVPMIAE